jgi:HSP20 family molecular chaperone IbpA
MDIYQTDKELIAELNLPDLNPEKIDISVKNQVLTVKGESEKKEEEKRKIIG